MKIVIEKPTAEKLQQLGVQSWPIWTKEKSVFAWEYDSCERCYFLQGKVKVTCENGDIAEFGAGDFVTFPKGLRCTWVVIEDVEKHYQFE